MLPVEEDWIDQKGVLGSCKLTYLSHNEVYVVDFSRYHLMQSCWKRYTSQRPQFVQVVEIVSSLLEYLRRDSVYSDESDEESLERSGSKKSASRTPSIRSG